MSSGPRLNRRTLLGTIVAGSAGVGALTLEQMREAAEVAVEGEVTKESVDKRVNESVDEEVNQQIDDELSSYKLSGIDADLFADAYEEVLDDSEELADRILPERVYDHWTNGEDADGELKQVDFMYGESDAINSEIRYLRDFDDRDDVWSSINNIDDTAAGELHDALESNYDGDSTVEDEYGVEQWPS